MGVGECQSPIFGFVRFVLFVFKESEILKVEWIRFHVSFYYFVNRCIRPETPLVFGFFFLSLSHFS